MEEPFKDYIKNIVSIRKEKINASIKLLCKKRKLSQDDLAKALGVTRLTVITKYKNGNRSLSEILTIMILFEEDHLENRMK